MIDWEEQWASFAEGFKDGKAHIDLTKFGGASTLQLLPGPGFGDLSHPTTSLMLQLMQSKIKGQSVLDIGCGSGILTLAALLLGARIAVGVDIDSDAIVHAQKNKKLNQLQAHFSLSLPKKKFDIALMNMISSEQEVVMNHRIDADLWITSGVLVKQRKDYLALTNSWGWTFVDEAEEEGWLGMVFKTIPREV
jgi:ribosomal protein L11 methyltransferase